MSKRNWTKEQLDDIVYLYTQQGWTIKQIEQKYKCGHGFVSHYLDSQNVPKNVRKKNRLLNDNYFNIIDTPAKAYFLGLMFTDGSVVLDKERQANISLELVESDKAILELLCKELNSNCGLSYNKRDTRTNGTFTFSIRSNKIANDLAKYNIIPNKTYNVKELVIPENFKLDYLRGLFDGDGSIYYSQDLWHINICGHHESIIRQIAEEVNKLTGQLTHKITCSNSVYRYTWNGKYAKEVIKLLYPQGSTCVIARKFDKARQALEDKNTQDIV